MEESPKTRRGRPEVDPLHRKKNRAISLTDAQYERLKELAGAKKLGVSAFIIAHHKLSN